MPSDGERHALIEKRLRGVRSLMENLDQDLDTAVGSVEEELRDEVRQRWERDRVVVFRRTGVLSGGGGRRAWFADHDPAGGYHWPRLRSFLLTGRGRSEGGVEDLDDASDKILAHLEDPRPGGPGPFRVQGLVLGRVQSGKTANFTAVIAKAADAGYRFVIVLSGIHNSLRIQTQQRLVEELGLRDEANLGRPGVGQPEATRRWLSITDNTFHGDFRPGTSDVNVLQGNDTVIAVVKKNATVLRRLNQWLANRPAGAHLPVLIIDDEADQASINTGGNRTGPGDIPETDPDAAPEDLVDLDTNDTDGDLLEETNPSVINGLIRDLISQFEQVAYVAYTATPFANILIDPDAVDRDAGHDLYPRDFVISLATPADYVGAERLFGRDPTGSETEAVEGLNVIRIVPEHEIPYLIPARNQPWDATVTDTLRLALIDYLLVTAAKLDRLGDGTSTMLIHTTPRIAPQIKLGEVVRDEMRTLRQAWRYGDPADRDELRARWDTEHRPLIASLDITRDRTFDALEDHITQLMRDGIDVAVLNSGTDDQLGYDTDPQRKVIVIGGNRLSRGLTLEDLVVSYYVRAAANYDTLLQMGRWFGYRDRYVDLTRLWTTETLVANFRHLALVEEDLREQIAIQDHQGLTPLEFAPLILAHPDMAPTAKNKMGAGQKIDVSYAGQLVQSVRFHLDQPEVLDHNLTITRDLVTAIGPPAPADPVRPDGRTHWQDIDWEVVAGYIAQYRSPAEANSFHPAELAAYIRRQAEEHRELQRWWISIRHRLSPDGRLGGIDLTGSVGHVNAISRSRLSSDKHSVGVLTNPARATGTTRSGDEELGLTDEQIAAAREAYGDEAFHRYGTALRHQRHPTEGLLCIYPISAASDTDTDDRKKNPNRVKLFTDMTKARDIIGLAVGFPPSASAATRTRIGGPAGDPAR